MRFVSSGKRLADFPVERCMVAKVEGIFIALTQVDGQVYAVDNNCPHRGGPLGMGNLDGEWLVCPYHNWAYSVKSGVWDNDPKRFIKTFPVKVEGDEIFVGLEDPVHGSSPE